MYRGASNTLESFITAIIYSKPGVGKTTLLCSSAEHAGSRGAATLAVDVEGGVKGRFQTEYGPSITIMRPTTFSDFNDIYNKLSEHLSTIAKIKADWNNLAKLKAHNSKLLMLARWFTGDESLQVWRQYLHVFIDSFSETQSQAMDFLVPAEGMLTLKNPEIQHWGKNINMIKFVTRAFRDLEINAWFAAHEMVKEDESSKRDTSQESSINLLVVPKFSGKTAPEDICGLVDIVGYYSSAPQGPESIKRTLYFSPVARIANRYAKDRFNVFGVKVESPTIAGMMAVSGLDKHQYVVTMDELMDRISKLSANSDGEAQVPGK